MVLGGKRFGDNSTAAGQIRNLEDARGRMQGAVKLGSG